ncbi:hypothetical protein C1925_16240 [Stenotrophomonas sp. SAU14A_NAIMI4_5]|uniref:patatin-like phospholipase family protein n=1 Tax=Stenotrophomonas sp. SAU14A_NAIMI4_5 TaxID=2072413 RepID=UPI000D541E3C|nr:patatin-like phospholipase family protein [Stenotrophomonas sp. SAU14A_NAIMI4_5]AWH50594.1 hypothetical protein C1925_16240 [Stenotrophomonas sp. SAU14A_NAIMI4_5]
MDVSIAFQGGGARVLELLAAAQACRAHQEEKKLKIIRASGTSAGAIAAAMLATNCDIPKVIEELPKLEREVSKSFPASRLKKAKIAFRWLRGLPIYSEKDVEDLLIKIFAFGGVDALLPLEDLVDKRYELRILRSDIRANTSRDISQNSSERLVDALVDSAAIPFVFRTPKKSNRPELIDGGIFQNLPAIEAAKNLPEGCAVLAFSFDKASRAVSKKTTLLEYGKAIIDSLVDERVESSVLGIKESNVIRLPQHRSTLDFKSIFTENSRRGFNDEVVSIKSKVLAWKDRYYGASGHDLHSTHPVDVAAASSLVRKRALDFFTKAKSATYHASLVRHEVTYEALGLNVVESIQMEVHIDGERNPGLQFLQFNYYAGSDSSLLRDVDLQVYDSNGNSRMALLLPFRIEGSRMGITNLVGLDRPLASGDMIRIVKVEKTYNGLARYEQEGLCWESFRMTPGKTTDRLEIVTHFRDANFPKHHGDARPDEINHREVYEEVGEGNQLKTKTRIDPSYKAGWKSLISEVDLTTLTNGMNFASVVYYKD